MARIAGVDLQKNKRIDISLGKIYGVGRANAKVILDKAKVDPSIKTQDLTEAHISAIRKVIDTEFKVEGDLRKEVSMNIKRLMDTQSYRGMRHRKNLPARGQRTKTNARTRKGPRKAAVVIKTSA